MAQWSYDEPFLTIDKIIELVFPRKYQETYHSMATLFISTLISHKALDSATVKKTLRENGHSASTFYNRVLPRLKSLGLVRTEKDPRDSRRVIYLPSDTFSTFFETLAISYKRILFLSTPGPGHEKRHNESRGTVA